MFEIRKNNTISKSTQPNKEFPCAFCWDSLKLRGGFPLRRATNKKKQRNKQDGKMNTSNSMYFQKKKKLVNVLWKERQLISRCFWMKDKWNSDRRSNEPDVFGCPFQDFKLKVNIIDNFITNKPCDKCFPKFVSSSQFIASILAQSVCSKTGRIW